MMVYCRETSSSGVCKHETAEKNQLMQVSSPKGCWEELLTATPTFSRSIGQWRHLRPVVTSGVSFFTTFSHSFSHSYKTDVFSLQFFHCKETLSVSLSLSTSLLNSVSSFFIFCDQGLPSCLWFCFVSRSRLFALARDGLSSSPTFPFRRRSVCLSFPFFFLNHFFVCVCMCHDPPRAWSFVTMFVRTLQRQPWQREWVC